MEVSIVLIILALTVGAVTLGQRAIQMAEQRKLVAFLTGYQANWSTFREKYDCLPGDCSDAVEFFTGNAANVGDGNKKIFWGAATVGGSLPEPELVWLHLEAAGLLPYEQGYQANYLEHPIHERTSRTVFFMGSTSNTDADLYGYTTNTTLIGNSLQAAYVQVTTPAGGILDPLYLYTVDKKFDDGFPHAGKFQGANGLLPTTGWYTTCVQNSGGTDVYVRTTTDEACIYSYKID